MGPNLVWVSRRPHPRAINLPRIKIQIIRKANVGMGHGPKPLGGYKNRDLIENRAIAIIIDVIGDSTANLIFNIAFLSIVDAPPHGLGDQGPLHKIV